MRFKNINRAGERPDPAAGQQTKISGTELKKKNGRMKKKLPALLALNSSIIT